MVTIVIEQCFIYVTTCINNDNNNNVIINVPVATLSANYRDLIH